MWVEKKMAHWKRSRKQKGMAGVRTSALVSMGPELQTQMARPSLYPLEMITDPSLYQRVN